MNFRFLILALILVTACASPSKHLKEGNYNKAYKQSLNQLKRGKSVRENKKILKKAMAQIIVKENRGIAKLLETKDIEDLEKAYDANQDLQGKIEKTFKYVEDGSFDQDYDGLREQANWMQEDIAETYFKFGESSLTKAIDNGDKKLAQQAYSDFAKAKKYGFSGNGIDDQMEECIEVGRYIYTVEASVSFGISYEWEIDRRFEDIEDYSERFRKIYYERANVDDVDCHLDIEFNSLDINYRDEVDNQTFTERVQTGTETTTDADGNVSTIPVYGNVQAQVRIIRRIKVAEWEVRVDIRSRSNNCELRDERFSETIAADIEQSEWSGDERAVPNRYRRPNNDELPDDDEMAEELADILYREILREYF
ncbi:MAG: hypothetical protein AB8F74_15975 [Saprospiraceae bacterium]